MNTKTCLKVLSMSAAVAGLSVSGALAQWTGTTHNSNYDDLANWSGGTINDVLVGPNSGAFGGPYYAWPSAPGKNNVAATFVDGGTTVSTGNNSDAWQLAPGQAISGAGIQAGTVITAITGSNTFTISNTTTANSSGNYNFAAANSAYFIINIANRELSGDFTYRNLGNTSVQLLEPATGVTTWKFTSANPVITVEMAPYNIGGRSFDVGAASRTMWLDFDGGNPVFNISPVAAGDGDDSMNIYAVINNAASLTKTGWGFLNLYREVNISGHLIVTGTTLGKGSVVLNNGNGNGIGSNQAKVKAAAVDVVGQRKSLQLQPYGFNENMLDPNTSVNLYAGALSLNGLVTGTWTSISQQVGKVSIYDRAFIGNVTNADNATLTLNSLERKNFATVNFVGNSNGRNLGDKSFIKITAGNDQNILDSLVGGKGAAGATNISILPWATGQALGAGNVEARNSGAWAGADFVTYTSAGGFRALTASEYKTFIGTGSSSATAMQVGAFAADDNLHLIAGGTGANGNPDFWANSYWTLNGNQTVNAIKFGLNQTNNYGSTNTLTLNAGQTLTVTSGAIMAGSGNGVNISGGILDTGTNPLITGGRSGYTISSAITNSITDPNQAGIISANVDNLLTLSGSNNYGGMTIAQTGLRIANNYALPSTTELRLDRDSDVRIAARATVRKLSGIGRLTVENNTTYGLRVGDGAAVSNRSIAIGANGILAPGQISGDYQAGTLMIGGGWQNNGGYDVLALTFEAGSTFAVDLADGANDLINFWNLTNPGKLEILGGTLSLNFLDGFTPDEGATWLLTQGFTTTAGLATNMTVSDLAHPDWEYELSYSGNNLMLTLTTIPEPSTWALLLGGGALLLTLRRRR